MGHLPRASLLGSVPNACLFAVQPSIYNMEKKALMSSSNAIMVDVLNLFVTLQEIVHFSEMNMWNSRRYFLLTHRCSLAG
jgi:hypothetical protein